MNFSPDIKHYIMHSETEKYVSDHGMVSDRSLATEFNIDSLRKWFKTSSKATIKLKEKIDNSPYRVIQSSEAKKQKFIINSNITYSEDDILYCEGIYHYTKDVAKMMVIYCPKSNIIRKSKSTKGEIKKIVFNVVKIVGKINK